MGILSSIFDKLRGRGSSEHNPGTQPTNTASAQPGGQPPNTAAGQQGGQPGATLQHVDVEKVLAEMATKKGGGGNYRQSIVDLLKLLDLDSSLNARKELAQELNVNAGAHGSAEQNIALHKAVMKKVAENGGKVPDSMKQ
jgi:hypothetical protein